jgi:hypothetical protein
VSLGAGKSRRNMKVWMREKSIKNSVSLCDAFHLATSLAVHRQSGNLTASDAAHQNLNAQGACMLGCRRHR